MMSLKFYYSPGTCSLVSHIALEEAGAEFELIRIALTEGQHKQPEYLRINPHARVPALATDRGIVTENIAIINLIADLFGAEGTVPTQDPYARAHANQLLGWCSSTVHVAFAQLWRVERFTSEQSAHGAIQRGGREALLKHFAEIDSVCGGEWAAGERFSAVDSYFLTFYRWARRADFDVTAYPEWGRLVQRALGRPAVQRAIESEGLKTAEFQSPVAPA